jgi:hypothetical protein
MESSNSPSALTGNMERSNPDLEPSVGDVLPGRAEVDLEEQCEDEGVDTDTEGVEE